VERVIIIGLDGAGSTHNALLTPNIVSFLQSGTYCDFAKSQIPSRSGPNWGSMLTGVVPAKHGVTNENIENHSYNETSEYPTLFKLILRWDSSAKTAALVSRETILRALIEPSLPVFKYVAQDEKLIDYITKEFLPKQGNQTKFLFIHLSAVDYAGHEFGFGSPEYDAEYTRTDVYFGRILEAITQNELKDSTLVFLSADHGGANKIHGGNSSDEMHVLWGMVGPGIRRHKFEPEQISNIDIPATTLQYLGIEVPLHFDGHVITVVESHSYLFIYVPVGLVILFVIVMAFLIFTSKMKM